MIKIAAQLKLLAMTQEKGKTRLRQDYDAAGRKEE